MVEIGGKPILWHIMKLYSAHGINDFVVCLGYRGYVIKEYFANYYLHMSTCRSTSPTTRWRCTRRGGALAGHAGRHGRATQTGGRLKRVMPYLGDEDFCFTYGDGVSDVDIGALIAFHREQGSSRP